MSNDPYEQSLHSVRVKIDAVDTAILKLLADRSKLVREVHDIKVAHNLPIRQMGRYQEMMNVLSNEAKELGVSQRLVYAVWEVIHDNSIRTQEGMEEVK